MAYDNDPVNNPVDRVRLMVGDIDPFEEILSDDVYKYILATNSSNEKRTALQALRYIVAALASCVTEKAGGLFVKESEKYDHYKDLLKRATSDPSFSFLAPSQPHAGGISKQDICDNAEN